MSNGKADGFLTEAATVLHLDPDATKLAFSGLQQQLVMMMNAGLGIGPSEIAFAIGVMAGIMSNRDQETSKAFKGAFDATVVATKETAN
jgi:hypothetical protein